MHVFVCTYISKSKLIKVNLRLNKFAKTKKD